MTDQNEDMRATAREWRIALFVVLGGFVIAAAVAVYFAIQSAPAPAPVAQAPKPLTAQQRHELALKIGKVLCDAELLNAKSIGIVPPYARGAGQGLPTPANVPRRYVCVVSTGVAKYAIAADLKCNEILDPRCVVISTVTSDDGTVLFKRPDTAAKPAK
jgi:hypothetical protein